MKNALKTVIKITAAVAALFGALIITGIAFLYGLSVTDDGTPSEPTYAEIIFDSLPEEKKVKSKSSGFGQGFEGMEILYYDDISDYFTSEKNRYFFRVNGKTAEQLKEFIKSFEEGALFKFNFDYNCIDASDWAAFINPEWKSEDDVGGPYIHTSRSYVFFDSQTNTLYYFFQEL